MSIRKSDAAAAAGAVIALDARRRQSLLEKRLTSAFSEVQEQLDARIREAVLAHAESSEPAELPETGLPEEAVRAIIAEELSKQPELPAQVDEHALLANARSYADNLFSAITAEFNAFRDHSHAPEITACDVKALIQEALDTIELTAPPAAPMPVAAAPVEPQDAPTPVLLYGLRWRGQWEWETDYSENDLVRYDGKVWIAVEDNRNSPPDVFVMAWELFVEDGKDGNESHSTRTVIRETGGGFGKRYERPLTGFFNEIPATEHGLSRIGLVVVRDELGDEVSVQNRVSGLDVTVTTNYPADGWVLILQE